MKRRLRFAQAYMNIYLYIWAYKFEFLRMRRLRSVQREGEREMFYMRTRFTFFFPFLNDSMVLIHFVWISLSNFVSSWDVDFTLILLVLISHHSL